MVFADCRKMRPASILRQPIEKRKKAATRVKVSTWCESTAAPILKAHVNTSEVTVCRRTYRHSMIPRAPRPKSSPIGGVNNMVRFRSAKPIPKTGKNRLKNAEGQPNSDRTRIKTWPIINSLLSTAQKTPRASFGTVLPLRKMNQKEIRMCGVSHHTQCSRCCRQG